MSYDANKLATIIGSVVDTDIQVLFSDYFGVENARRQSVFDVLYDNVERLPSVLERQAEQGISPGLDFYTWHIDDVSHDDDAEPHLSHGKDPLGKWNSAELVKYIQLQGDRTDHWQGKKVYDLGSGNGHVSAVAALYGAHVTSAQENPEGQVIGCCTLIIHNLEATQIRGADVDPYPGMIFPDTIDMDQDIYILNSIFDSEICATPNLAVAQKLAAAGKEILIVCHNKGSGDNHYFDIPDDELDIVFRTHFFYDPEVYGPRTVYRMVV